jgi:acetyl-CoA carboxylase carboxyl transferase subunit alpha
MKMGNALKIIGYDLTKQKKLLKIDTQDVEGPSVLSVWEQVQLARHKDRPQAKDYIDLLCKDFFELRGDRSCADDPAIIGGLANFAERTVMVIGHRKGRTREQEQACNSGMPHSEGYRKAQRLMRHAEKFGVPVICLIDTPGAFPGPDAERRGLAQAIAESLAVMVTLRVPTVAAVIGEGGSGGALALSLADRVLMLEHSIYAVVSPAVTATALLQLGLIDGIIPEPLGGAHLDHATSGQFLAERLHRVLTNLAVIPIRDLVAQRHAKFRNSEYFSLV